jgi:hypothetical protein
MNATRHRHSGQHQLMMVILKCSPPTLRRPLQCHPYNAYLTNYQASISNNKLSLVHGPSTRPGNLQLQVCTQIATVRPAQQYLLGKQKRKSATEAWLVRRDLNATVGHSVGSEAGPEHRAT